MESKAGRKFAWTGVAAVRPCAAGRRRHTGIPREADRAARRAARTSRLPRAPRARRRRNAWLPHSPRAAAHGRAAKRFVAPCAEVEARRQALRQWRPLCGRQGQKTRQSAAAAGRNARRKRRCCSGACAATLGADCLICDTERRCSLRTRIAILLFGTIIRTAAALRRIPPVETARKR